MNKNIITYSFIALLIIFIIYASIKLFVEPRYESIESTIVSDTNKNININGKDLSVLFTGGEVLDINLTYGNIYEKEVLITNNNSEDIIYSLKLTDSFISNNNLYYDLFISYNNQDYIQVVTDSILSKDLCLVYNLKIDANSTNKIKVVFKSKHEREESVIKGRLIISDNITALELFNINLNEVTDALDKKISKLNGISTKGYYLINTSDLGLKKDIDLKGYILIDASDISDIKYIYTIYNDKYMVINSDSKNLNIVNIDNDYVNSLNNNVVCNQYDSRITCSTNIPKSNNDEKGIFYNKVKDLISLFNKEYNKDDDRTYIYDINEDLSNSYSLKGYILKDKNNMFLYIRNDIFMISGYNYSKLGDFDIKSTTIRSYVPSAFELSANDKLSVCGFSGYDTCYDAKGNLIGE